MSALGLIRAAIASSVPSASVSRFRAASWTGGNAFVRAMLMLSTERCSSHANQVYERASGDWNYGGSPRRVRELSATQHGGRRPGNRFEMVAGGDAGSGGAGRSCVVGSSAAEVPSREAFPP